MEEARSKQLPGSEVFRRSHLYYFSDFNRDWGVVALNREAYKAFSDTILVRHRAELEAGRKAMEEWLKQGGFSSSLPFPWSAAGQSQLEYMNLEYLKLGCGFELHLKARLLSRDYLVHNVEKNDRYRTLANEQKQRPVKKVELLTIDGFRFNGRENYLPGLKPRSIDFWLLTDKEEYIKALDLPRETIAVIKHYRKLRNQIHLPGDDAETPELPEFRNRPILEFLLSFVNMEVVSWSNQIIANRGFTFPRLADLTGYV